MTLNDFEKELANLRFTGSITFRYLAEQHLDQYVVKRIEEGGNYSVQSLLTYLEVLNFYLQVNGHRVLTLEELGQDGKIPIRINFNEIGVSPNNYGKLRNMFKALATSGVEIPLSPPRQSPEGWQPRRQDQGAPLDTHDHQQIQAVYRLRGPRAPRLRRRDDGALPAGRL